MTPRGACAGFALAACALAALAFAPLALARKVNVHPGKNAIPKAMKRAHAGDTLKIHKGTYRGGFAVRKELKLVGSAKHLPVIDGRCATNRTITVAHDGVTLDRLEVVGADEGFGQFPSEVYYEGIGDGRSGNLVVRDTCDAEYGINVFQSGNLEIENNTASGFSDAGIYIGAITDTHGGVLRVSTNTSTGNNRGIIVEDSAGGEISIQLNLTKDNTLPGDGAPDGIFLTNSDGVRIDGNTATGNGVSGIHLNPTSDNNVLRVNTAIGQPMDLFNEGSGNCAATGNTFGTTAGNPLPSC